MDFLLESFENGFFTGCLPVNSIGVKMLLFYYLFIYAIKLVSGESVFMNDFAITCMK